MRMPSVNVYLPEDLAIAVREAGLNVSGIAQSALSEALDSLHADRWLDEVLALPTTGVSHDDAMRALDDARDELSS